MRKLGNLVILVVLIAAVSAGVYYWMEERNEGPLEEAGENVDRAVDDLADDLDNRQ